MPYSHKGLATWEEAVSCSRVSMPDARMAEAGTQILVAAESSTASDVGLKPQAVA